MYMIYAVYNKYVRRMKYDTNTSIYYLQEPGGTKFF